ncbi:unnamed protein product [Effrenium voratum]|nr:unnamed protein product [Effrenium voratum]
MFGGRHRRKESFCVVLDFTAPWCKPCQAIKPRYQALAGEYQSHCFMQVNADDLDDVSARCAVMGLPCFQIYQGSKLVASTTGGDESNLVKFLGDNLGKKAQ